MFKLNKFIIMFFLITFVIVSLTVVYSLSFEPRTDKIKDIILHPWKYPRLPNDLTPYCCGEVINGRCNGKVDLALASEMINKGLDPKVVFVPDKASLKCD